MNISQPQPDHPSESDIELLSGYLDNQLSVSERVTLERRLGSEPQLRAELEDLRATVGVLRDLDPVRPPRSFTLDPAAAPRRATPLFGGFARLFQFGSGFAGLALVLLASVQLFFGGRASAVFVEVNSGLSDAPMASAPMSVAATEAPFLAQATAPAALESAPSAAFAPTEAPAAPAAAAGAAAPTEAPAATLDPAAAVIAPPTDARQSTDPAAAGVAEAQPTVLAYDQGSAAGSQPANPADEQPAAKATPPVQITPPILLGIGIALIAVAGGLTLYRRRDE